MWLDALERRRPGNGPLQRIAPRWLLLGTLAFVVTVVATPVGARWLLAAEGLVLAVAIGLSRVPLGDLLRRWLGLLVLVGFLALMIAPSHPARGAIGLWGVVLGIVARNGLAILALLTLSGVVAFPRLLDAMGRLGAPPVLVATLHFMYRYLHVLTAELDRMVQARRARSFRRDGGLDWGLLTGLVGVLFVRAFERGERVHAAMLARGWDGTLRRIED